MLYMEQSYEYPQSMNACRVCCYIFVTSMLHFFHEPACRDHTLDSMLFVCRHATATWVTSIQNCGHAIPLKSMFQFICALYWQYGIMLIAWPRIAWSQLWTAEKSLEQTFKFNLCGQVQVDCIALEKCNGKMCVCDFTHLYFLAFMIQHDKQNNITNSVLKCVNLCLCLF